MAKKGLNVALISRTKSKLEAVAAEIKDQANVETKCIVADFSGGVEIYDSIGKQLDGIDIGILVNNVGVAYEHPQYFHLVENRCVQPFALLIYAVSYYNTYCMSV